ncbi:MAG: S1 RNA-binding domain-containing protein [Oscillospiraceae bacterium]|jgi:small subunit ribosomal protein S1|nr:S1 RNA-binding domain-containing protein [Oscillospiraceae bacterium]
MRIFLPEGALIADDENVRAMQNEASLKQAQAAGQVLESRAILCDSAHNLHVSLGTMRGVIPRSEGALGIDNGQVRDVALLTRVNKPVQFIVERFCGDTVFLSRKAVQSACCQEYLRSLQPGHIVTAVVTRLESFGVFCDVGAGISALLPVSQICVSRIEHPCQRLRVGMKIRAAVRNIDHCGRITLTMKELLGTWSENAANFNIGDTVPGIIRSVEHYGIFVELTPNLSGLAEFVPGLHAGMSCSVYVKAIIPEKMKIKLVLVDAFSQTITPESPFYYVRSNRIEHWLYSPRTCEKVIETHF